MRKAVIVAYGRSGCSRARKGPLAQMNPIDYAAQVLKGVLAKVPQLDPAEIGDVIVGCAFALRELNMNAGRLIVNRAELPECVPGRTVNRFCSSGLQTIADAANAIVAGQEEIIVAGGVESMSRCFGPEPPENWNPWLTDNYEGAYISMGETAERVAEKYGISREEMEAMAVESHRKAAAAKEAGLLDSSIIPVTLPDGTIFAEDDGIRPGTSMESLAGLKPCFRPDGRVTAATSSQTTDAAAFVVLMSEEKAAELEITPIAELKGFAVAGCDGTLMGLGPIFAVPKLMKRLNMSVEDMDVIEINEAFASQSLACIRDLKFDVSKINPYGGAMALGHPLGATGSILVGKALDYLAANNGRNGLITMCIGGGMGAAAVVEKR